MHKLLFIIYFFTGNNKELGGPTAAKNGARQTILPIEIWVILLAKLNKLTKNFGPKALIGEGSYGKIYQATLSTGQAVAIKKLDPTTSQENYADFVAQVNLLRNYEKYN